MGCITFNLNRVYPMVAWVGIGLLSGCNFLTDAAEAAPSVENVPSVAKATSSVKSEKGAWQEEKEKAEKRVRITKVEAEAYVPSVEVSGRALAARESMLSLGVPGLIKYIGVHRGDRVKQGQVLLKLDQAGFKLGVAQAEAASAGAASTLEQLGTEIARVQQLLAEGAAPSAALDDLNAKNKGASAQSDMAAASLKQANKALADSVLKAPYAGVVTEIYKEVGEQAPAMPPTMLMKIVDASTLEVQVFVPEESGRLVALGDTAEVTVDSAGTSMKGKIIFVSDAISPGARTFETRVRIDNPDLRIKAGSFARVRFSQSSTAQSVLIPIAEVNRDENDLPYVFVEEKGVARKKPIVLGNIDGVRVLVANGLSVGDHLIVSDASGLEDGQRVSLEE